ncbi:RagB/SusD family nutrient uptake outer membrane protein [Phocaeicola sp.]
MKASIKKYIVALALSPMLLSSCSDSFLNEVNPNEETEQSFWTNEQNVTKGLVAVYNPIRDHMYGYYGVFSGIWNNNMRADDIFPTRNEDAWGWGVVNFTNTTESGDGTSNIWSTLYETIQYANNFIYYAPTVDMDQKTLNEMLGEAYFMRGFHYFLLHINFRDAVIRTLPMVADPEQHPLSSGEEVLAQCEKDFIKAKELLPTTRPTTENGRILKGAASAMLGKTYLWQKRYADAKEELGDVITGYGYDLVDYENNFRNDTEFNKESVYELNYAQFDGADNSLWGDQEGTTASMANNIANFFAPECSKGGWYKMQPSAHLIEEFIKEERPAGSDSRFDKRLYTTCFFPHSDYNDAMPDELAWEEITFEEMWKKGLEKKLNPGPKFPSIDGKAGRFLLKKWSAWWCEDGASMYAGNKARDLNYRVMRFAEVLFLHAEACLETNDIPSAMSDINKVRVRAGLPEVSITDMNGAWEELRHQKLLEFAGENIRWYDLIRWYDTYEELKAYLTATKDPGQNISAMQEKHRYLPIPQGEVDANQYMEQKPEWK